jgi:hypothetical protein
MAASSGLESVEAYDEALASFTLEADLVEQLLEFLLSVTGCAATATTTCAG